MNQERTEIIKTFFNQLTILFFGIILIGCSNTLPQQKNKSGKEENSMVKSSDPWTKNDIIKPDELSKILSDNKSGKPEIIQIGFSFLYEQNHIPGAKYMGPASNADGIRSIKEGVKDLNKNKNIVIYCGCCPWGDCPNIHPAFKTLHDLGFKNVKLLYIPHTFVKDWVDKGFPDVKGN